MITDENIKILRKYGPAVFIKSLHGDHYDYEQSKKFLDLVEAPIVKHVGLFSINTKVDNIQTADGEVINPLSFFVGWWAEDGDEFAMVFHNGKPASLNQQDKYHFLLAVRPCIYFDGPIDIGDIFEVQSGVWWYPFLVVADGVAICLFSIKDGVGLIPAENNDQPVMKYIKDFAKNAN